MIWMPVFLQHGAEIATLYVYVVDKFGAYKLQGGIYSFDASNAGTLLQDTEIADDTPAGLTALTLGAPWTKVGNGLVWLGVNVREASLHMAGSTFSGYYGGGDYATLPASFTGLSWHGATYGIWIGIGQAGTF